MTAWLVLQIAEVTFEPMGFPVSAMRILIHVVLAGFPIAFVLGWIIELGPKGFMFDLPLWPTDGTERRRSRRTDPLILIGVAAMLVFGISSALNMLQGGPASEPVEGDGPNSIAVLAFDTYDSKADTDYFSSGLAEEILNLLSGLPELNVAARTSSFQFRGEKVDVREVASTLDVRNVLEGSVQRSGDSVSVTARLINGGTGYQKWAQKFDRDMADVFAIQREIAAAVVAKLKVVLSVESEAKLNADPTKSTDAYLLYLQGTEKLRNSRDESSLTAAADLFDQALQIDPEFARALAGRCDVDLALYEIGNDTRQFEKAAAACNRAAELDRGQSAEIHVALARLYRFRGWNDKAQEQLQEAMTIAVNDVDAYIEQGELRMAMDQLEEAEASFLQAVDMKPNYWKAHEALASFYYRTQRYQKAIQSYATVTRLAPDMASAWSGTGAAYWMLGDVDQARVAWDRSLELNPSRRAYTNLGLRYYYGGHFEDAVAMQLRARELAPDDHRVWGRLAESYRFVGGKDSESLQAYKRAAALAQANLAINESDWATRGLLGIYYAYGDQPTRAEQEAERAVTDSQRNAEALYYLGLVRLKLGKLDGAIDVLAEALQRDPQYLQFLQSDPDLKSLHSLPRYVALLGEKAEPKQAPSLQP
ncbi:tetratricopeptide repeat protein [Dokdonella sp.]|uniref:tetratricopeptide repeat protein n=1 Tax=Dokdonella sp. TaxID=2291710 RepID=UPI003526ED7E